ncbi:ABC transporter permease [Flavobacteriaceae bacterium S356]|uniref:Transport permease protein n=1 Tax=Asprobacillus argus TaxID=3076534 RepID=A0ABU3LE69_9FLAO|nr:ABC transporter permease [Flavobacteriaceae bacterium S356]
MKSEKWLFEITPKSGLLDLKLKEVWRYRDLLMLFVKRDVITLYKQTVLGPLWYVIQPLFTAVIFTLVFNKIAGIETEGIPPFLFNLAGITIWNYFKECLTATSDTFKKNEAIFGKVYFPRIIIPLSIVISNLLKFGIQLVIFIAFYIYYVLKGSVITPNSYLILYPLIIICMGIIGLGLGMIISSMVTKYRDLTFLVAFGIQLLMYMSAVMYPIAIIKENLADYAWVVTYNPLAYLIESSRLVLLDSGDVSIQGLIYTGVVSVSILFLGIIVFNRTEKTFIDTI